MRALPLLVPAGCTLSSDGLADQLARAARLGGAVTREKGGIGVAFGPELDQPLLEEFVRTERGCCSFLDVRFDETVRVLRITSSEPRGREVVEALAGAFGVSG